MSRWFGPGLPVWNHVYRCPSGVCGSHYTAFFIAPHKPQTRSCLRLWTCCSLSGRSVLSSDLQWLIHWGLCPNVTSSEWPLLIPFSPPAPLHPLTLLNILQNASLPKLHSSFIYCLPRPLEHKRCWGPELELIYYDIPRSYNRARLIVEANKYLLNEQREWRPRPPILLHVPEQ